MIRRTGPRAPGGDDVLQLLAPHLRQRPGRRLDGQALGTPLLDLGRTRSRPTGASITTTHAAAPDRLKKLKEGRLLISERRGPWVYYRVEPSMLAAMGRLLAVR
ncbi:hypothetical protein [Streptomyces sp. SudanB91_2054]|uniref:hypothetical protein n=1 Tax=Streptomyces sp. SudanB91_2054 TaxID=3035278 RepID=UPI0036DAA68F